MLHLRVRKSTDLVQRIIGCPYIARVDCALHCIVVPSVYHGNFHSASERYLTTLRTHVEERSLCFEIRRSQFLSYRPRTRYKDRLVRRAPHSHLRFVALQRLRLILVQRSIGFPRPLRPRGGALLDRLRDHRIGDGFGHIGPVRRRAAFAPGRPRRRAGGPLRPQALVDSHPILLNRSGVDLPDRL